MNGSLTMLAFAMASLGGATPPEHIPPAPVPATAYQGLDCAQLMGAAEVADADLGDAWDRQEMLVRHRFGAPPTIVRRSEMQVSQLKGELEAIWRVADRKGCGEATGQTDLAWAPGREPGPMLGDPRERSGEAFGPEAEQPGAEAEAEAAYAEDSPPADAADVDEPAFADEPQPADMAAVDDDLAGGPPPEESDEVEGYGEPEPQADPRAAPPAQDAGPARWPSAGDRSAPPVNNGRPLDDVDWPKGD
ncbi:MAG: hypothetical protein JWR84_583 [Caulobacter sp.]|nr:hypothetical protein [Caulobacter sp.]